MTEHHGMAGTSLKPDINDVHFFPKIGRAAARAFGPRREDPPGFVLVPGVRSFAGKHVDHGLMRFFGFQQLATAGAEEDRDGHAPYTLAGDAPVRAGGDHVGDTLFTPGRNPLYFLDFVQGATPQSAAAYRR